MRDPLEGVTADGMIITGVARWRVPAAFEPILTAATSEIRERGEHASVYLYGSVATGRARIGHSDVDLFGVGLDPGAAAAVSSRLSRQFASICRSVEVGSAELADFVGESDRAHGNRVFLRHYCLRLAGDDPVPLDDGYCADAAAARGFNGDIGQHAERWRAELETATGRTGLGRRIARKTLFAVTGLVSIHDGTWTTDRAGAARRWADIEPSSRDGLATLLRWSESIDAPEASELAVALDVEVTGVVSAFAEMIGLW